MTLPNSTERETGADLLSATRVSWHKRLAEWCVPPAVVVLMFLIAVFGNPDGNQPLSATIRWLFIVLIAAAAWVLPRWLAISAAVLALVPWSVVEWQRAGGINALPSQAVRLIVTVGLVTWLSYLREHLRLVERLARVDSLTGLPNRQALIEALEAEIGRAKRFGRPFSLAMLDCDGFKSINDRNGHLAGDEVLRRLGGSLRNNTRPFDCAGRWGGDEFLLVLSEAGNTDAELLAERLRAAIRHDVERDYSALAFSLGVVTFIDPSQDWQDCVDRADRAMYAAKRLGRNETRFEVVGPTES